MNSRDENDESQIEWAQYFVAYAVITSVAGILLLAWLGWFSATLAILTGIGLGLIIAATTFTFRPVRNTAKSLTDFFESIIFWT